MGNVPTKSETLCWKGGSIMAKKVGDLKDNGKGTGTGTGKCKVKKSSRSVYDTTLLAGATNEEGLLILAPEDFNSRKHFPLKKEQFVSESVYLKYQSLVASQKAEFYAQKAKELAGKAERLEKFGSDAARKAAEKLVRAKKQMAILRKQLEDSGMSSEELDALIETM